jgi:hypothetical protein
MKKIILIAALFIGVSIQPSVAQKTGVAVKFNKSLDSYYALKNALATDKPAEAGQLALALSAAVKAVPHTGFATDAQHHLWMEQSAVIMEQSAALAVAPELAAQRKTFRPISDAFVKLVTELKINTRIAYVQYCPMGRYTWLNEVKAVQNPFYGSQMYDCGEVKETIAGK